VDFFILPMDVCGVVNTSNGYLVVAYPRANLVGFYKITGFYGRTKK
jgi:hypothetical protein